MPFFVWVIYVVDATLWGGRLLELSHSCGHSNKERALTSSNIKYIIYIYIVIYIELYIYIYIYSNYIYIYTCIGMYRPGIPG